MPPIPSETPRPRGGVRVCVSPPVPYLPCTHTSWAFSPWQRFSAPSISAQRCKVPVSRRQARAIPEIPAGRSKGREFGTSRSTKSNTAAEAQACTLFFCCQNPHQGKQHWMKHSVTRQGNAVSFAEKEEPTQPPHGARSTSCFWRSAAFFFVFLLYLLRSIYQLIGELTG